MADQRMTPPIAKVPLDILFLIFDLFEYRDQPVLAKVCTLWHDCLQSSPSARSKRYIDYPLPLEHSCPRRECYCHKPVLKIHRLLRPDELYSCPNPLAMEDVRVSGRGGHPWPYDMRKASDTSLKIFTEDPIFLPPGILSCPNSKEMVTRVTTTGSKVQSSMFSKLDQDGEYSDIADIDSRNNSSSSNDCPTVSVSQSIEYKYVTAGLSPIEVGKGIYSEPIIFTRTDTIVHYACILSERMKHLAGTVLAGKPITGSPAASVNNEILKKSLGTRYSAFEFIVDNREVLCEGLAVSLQIDLDSHFAFLRLPQLSHLDRDRLDNCVIQDIRRRRRENILRQRALASNIISSL